MPVYLSIIIPAYNEEKRIGSTLSKVCGFLKTKNYEHEVILVDDGSNDKTILEAKDSELAKTNKLKIVKNGMNKGKGFSVKNGVLNSAGEFVLFSDADLSTPIEEADKLFNYMGKGYDIVIGSRSIAGSDVRVRQPFYREKMGRVFNFFVSSLLMGGFVDTQCGFKLRIWGLNFGLPYQFHQDEPIVVNHALAYGAGDLNPHFFIIPPLASYI